MTLPANQCFHGTLRYSNIVRGWSKKAPFQDVVVKVIEVPQEFHWHPLFKVTMTETKAAKLLRLMTAARPTDKNFHRELIG